MDDELKKQADNTEHLRPYQWKKGQSGNPKGRPPGRSLKDRAKAMLASMTDDEFEDFLHGLDKKTIWEMAEGKADTKSFVEAKLDHNVTVDPKVESLLDEIIRTN